MAWEEYELYVGGPSHLYRGTYVIGTMGNHGLSDPDFTDSARTDTTDAQAVDPPAPRVS